MNAKTSKLLRRYCLENDLDYRWCKRWWLSTPRPTRHALRERIKSMSRKAPKQP